MIRQHLPALQVVNPLLSAPLCLLLNKPRVAWALSLIASWLALIIAIALLQQVLSTGTLSYELGGWAA
ncbi:MAG: hypothetical protein V3V64_07665, partial [Acidiferrobacterales bacterium]